MELVYICRDYDEWFHCSALTISVYINDGWHVLCALARERNRESETETLPLNRRKSVTLQTECRVCLKRWRKKKTTKHWTVNRSFNLCVFEMWPSCRITRIARYSWKTRLIQMRRTHVAVYQLVFPECILHIVAQQLCGISTWVLSLLYLQYVLEHLSSYATYMVNLASLPLTSLTAYDTPDILQMNTYLGTTNRKMPYCNTLESVCAWWHPNSTPTPTCL